MGKIISKRGLPDPALKPTQDEYIVTPATIYVYDGSGNQLPLTPEEMKHIQDVFEGIRKSLGILRAY